MTRDTQAKVAAGLRAPQPDMWFSLGLPRNLIFGSSLFEGLDRKFSILVLSKSSVLEKVADVPQFPPRKTVVQKDQPIRCGAAVMNDEFDMESEKITELGKSRSDEYTERILAFVQDLESNCPEPFIPLLTDLALARALIVHLVVRYGPERGMTEARDAVESTLEQMKPMLERMKSHKGPPPQ